MAKLVYISQERVEKGLTQLQKMLAEDQAWQEELKSIKKFEVEEKLRRDADYETQRKNEQA